MESENPWDVKSVYDLLVFKCPACIFLNSSKQKFVDHAFENHPESIASLLNVCDGSLEDILIPEENITEEDPLQDELEKFDKIDVDHMKLEANEEDSKIENEISHENYTEDDFSKNNLDYNEEHQHTDILSKPDDDTKEPSQICCKICGTTFINKYLLRSHMNNVHSNNEIVEDKPLNLEVTLRGFVCKTCDDLLLMSYYNLADHILLKHSSNSNHENLQETNCDTCQKEFANSDELNKHQAVKHCKFCYVCFQNFDNPKILISHLLNEHQRIETYCLKCQTFFENTKQKLEHMKNCPEKFQCPLCPHSANNRNMLKYHIKPTHLKKVFKKAFDCEECNVSFKKIETMRKHIRRVHEGIIDFVTCEKCGEKFKGEDVLKYHIKFVHNNERNHKCKICGLMVRTKFYLKKHIATVHEKQKNVQCDQCGKEFFDKWRLRGHIRDNHEEPEKKFQCERCEKSFKTRTCWKIHFERMHVENKKFPCTKCTRSYALKHELEDHISSIHEGIKKFKCNECTSVFTRADNLRTHVRTVHLGIKAFKCESCGKEFIRSKYLEKHKISCH